MSETTVIQVKDLNKKFGDFEAIKNVSFHVNEGDVFGFLGPNGAGKSTTIRCLLSLIQPNRGEIQLFGKHLHTNRKEILSRIGCIIEKPDFYKYLSAQKNLEIFARISGAEVSAKEIEGMLEFVGLADRAKHKVKGFSHGMKQRLGIAQTLLHKPDLIILDEPTTGLDPQGIIEVRNLILRLKNEQHKTILLSSHQLSEIEMIANRMVIINKGHSIVEGSVSDLLNAEELLVKFEVNDADKAKTLLSAYTVKAINTTTIEILLNRNEISSINKKLVEANVLVNAIEPKRKLEDFFIKTIQN
ncbi:MAG: ABC transporter ATP-binding protein [Bacteroidia bacterium]|nr:ABC transporter ATP-binding protein [Bacteroidia bacterium]